MELADKFARQRAFGRTSETGERIGPSITMNLLPVMLFLGLMMNVQPNPMFAGERVHLAETKLSRNSCQSILQRLLPRILIITVAIERRIQYPVNTVSFFRRHHHRKIDRLFCPPRHRILCDVVIRAIARHRDEDGQF
ncbi:hypothetical protein PRIPAC_97556 [Pristionchus pacificus]|uniref:Uncharacterized protein n=1 Tax=Pristionchus pacificus TaxID=54126 RepID=A0A2A6D0F8_PRIPA|nr:hypothetical protein PRIPAC_97556 [Pristionchus pacificus]|eukprot:PDM83954.1 hypothetical protein PRIPAC_34146 [Pristionchus pacificus]